MSYKVNDGVNSPHDTYNPWDWYIYLHVWLIFMAFHAGKDTSPMDDMGDTS